MRTFFEQIGYEIENRSTIELARLLTKVNIDPVTFFVRAFAGTSREAEVLEWYNENKHLYDEWDAAQQQGQQQQGQQQAQQNPQEWMKALTLLQQDGILDANTIKQAVQAIQQRQQQAQQGQQTQQQGQQQPQQGQQTGQAQPQQAQQQPQQG